MTQKEFIQKVESMPNLELYYCNEKQCGIICTYALLRADKMKELKSTLGLSDLYVTWMPAKNPKGIVLEGTFKYDLFDGEIMINGETYTRVPSNVLLDCYDSLDIVDNITIGEFAEYGDKYLFRTKEGMMAAYKDDVANYWSI